MQAELPEGHVIEDFLLAETAFVRCLVKGDWSGGDAPDELESGGFAVFSGANSRPFKVRLTGSLKNAGIAFRPGGWRALFTQSHTKFADEMLLLRDIWGSLADDLFDRVEAAQSDDETIAAMEDILTKRLDEVGSYEVDEPMAKFERFSRQDSTIRIDDAADQIGLSVRQMERRCKHTFGLTPKGVLRRSRFLDMAAAMRGLSSPGEQALAELRYFDDSHLNKEFRRFADMTPGQFRETATPLHTAGLKFREESRYDD